MSELVLASLALVLASLCFAVRRGRQAPASLRDSEARFRSLTELSADWYWEQDENLRFTILSGGVSEKLLHSAESAIGKTRRDLHGNLFSEEQWQAHQAVLDAHQPFTDFTFRRVTPQGQTRWVCLSGQPIFDAKGNFKGYRGIGKDVTERILSEQRILRLNALYGALSATNEAIARAKDRDALFGELCRILVEHGGMTMAWVGRIDFENRHVPMIASFGPDECYQRGYPFSIDPSVPEGRGYLRAAVESKMVQIANDLQADPRIEAWRQYSQRSGFRSKALVPVVERGEVAFTLQLYSEHVGFFDEEMTGLLSRMGHDLSLAVDSFQRERERSQALAALADSEERFQLVVRGTNDGIFDWDMVAGATYLSPRFQELLGYEQQQLEQQTVSLEECVHPDDRALATTALEQHLSGRAAYQVEYRLRTKLGDYRWFHARGQATWDTQGRPIRFTGAVRDISGRKAAEQQVARLTSLYAALSQTNQAIVHIKDRQTLFERICQIAVEHGKLILAWIGTVDSADRWIKVTAARGRAHDDIKIARVSVNPDIQEGRGFVGTAVREDHPVVCNDLLADSRVAFRHDWLKQAGIRSMCAFPLHENGAVAAVLVVESGEVGFFTEQLVELLREMAIDISFALDNIRREAEREAAQRALEASEEKFRLLAANIPQVFWIAEPGVAHVIYVSPAYQQVWGRTPDQLLSNPLDWLEAVHPEDRPRVEIVCRSETGQFDHEYRILRSDGSTRWIHDRGFPIVDEHGRVALVTGIAEDVTARKEGEKRLLHLAHYDNLTQLPNRVLFYDRLRQSLAHCERDGRAAAVMFLDLDRFKLVNDTLGHNAGDQLLQLVARRVADTLRPGDSVGRLGGDEFAVILCDLACADDASSVARKLMLALEHPFKLDGHEIFVTASAGITLFPADGEDADVLIGNADVAMYRAKELGRGNFQFYKAEMNARSVERLSMENHLRRALDRNEFLLHYQPKVDLVSGQITGVEALLRWNHPELGLTSPARFVPILEDNGLIVPVGEWVLAEACRQLSAWIEQGVGPLTVAVNVSGRQLQLKDMDQNVSRILSKSGVDPRLIELEITESVLMRNAEHAVGILRQLKALGVRLSVDDFGTGYSSLSYLKSFPLDALKIDRSFVRDITTDSDDALITRAVISLAHSLQLKVVAEGVETEAQLASLAASGCDEMQGYYFSRPVDAAECLQLLRERRKAKSPGVTDAPASARCCWWTTNPTTYRP